MLFRSPISRLRAAPLGLPDVAVILGALVALALLARVGAGTLVSFVPNKTVPHVDLNPRNLPYYAARSTLRMFVALSWSTAFTLVYGYVAARSRRAERVLIPLLDVLQSVPVLGFLSITVTGFIALFPGNLLGLELASVFAIFTSQAWNMAFAFYQSLRSIPAELDEAARLYGLSGWQRFVQIDVPSSMIGLVWNAMMSFGGGWFFLAASEAISVLNQQYTLPGVGSYVAAAIVAKDVPALVWAAVTIAVVIVVVDQLFWKPLVAWSDKFRMEQSAAAAAPSSWVYDLLRGSILPGLIARVLRPGWDLIGRILGALTAPRPRRAEVRPSSLADRLYDLVLLVAVVGLAIVAAAFVIRGVGLLEVVKVFGLGFLTLGRVVVLLIFATLIWTPLGVAIGFSPRLARTLQPVVQFLASFPANLIFPFATIAFIRFHVSINWGCILLMALGAQWYILFNTIAGAQSIPTELREMMADLEITGWLRWRRLIIPGIFSSWVTGAITASGGAWNASIVSEVVSWGSVTLTAAGLGTYIADATAKGDWIRITLGISVMSMFVVAANRFFWRRLYRYAEERFSR
ncbi:MAG TPA: ABC transporter permease subunit [Verrucomicrobiae bacterium]|nr:ABC transporter permease subunit [Verrucomicrobiae bacterium]